MKRVDTTLCCVVDEEAQKILMVLNYRGIGAGKYNFPGGKKAKEESFLECAIRETKEETGVSVENLQKVGVLEFLWPNEDMLVYNEVYLSKKHSGSLISQTAECRALWVDFADIPFDEMWPSDKIWVPQILDAKPFHFEFTHQNKEDKNPPYRSIIKDFIRTDKGR